MTNKHALELIADIIKHLPGGHNQADHNPYKGTGKVGSGKSSEVKVGDRVQATGIPNGTNVSGNRGYEVRERWPGFGNTEIATTHLVKTGTLGTVIARDDEYGMGWETRVDVKWDDGYTSKVTWTHSPYGKPLDSFNKDQLEERIQEDYFLKVPSETPTNATAQLPLTLPKD